MKISNSWWGWKSVHQKWCLSCSLSLVVDRKEEKSTSKDKRRNKYRSISHHLHQGGNHSVCVWRRNEYHCKLPRVQMIHKISLRPFYSSYSLPICGDFKVKKERERERERVEIFIFLQKAYRSTQKLTRSTQKKRMSIITRAVLARRYTCLDEVADIEIDSTPAPSTTRTALPRTSHFQFFQIFENPYSLSHSPPPNVVYVVVVFRSKFIFRF